MKWKNLLFVLISIMLATPIVAQEVTKASRQEPIDHNTITVLLMDGLAILAV